MPKIPQLTWQERCRDYWFARINESGFGVDKAEAHNRCWRCAEIRKLQKCHITPKSAGGSDEESNIIPLCAPCHDEAPDVEGNPEAMFDWIRDTCVPFYGTYWTTRAWFESDLAFATHWAVKIFSMRLRKFSPHGHFGQHAGGYRMKPETLTQLFLQAAKGIPGVRSLREEIKKGRFESITIGFSKRMKRDVGLCP